MVPGYFNQIKTMKHKLVIAMVAAATVGVAGLSSCNSMKSLGSSLTKMGLNPFEKTNSVSATVVHASTPVYHAGGEHIMGKGKGEIKTTEGWSQNLIVRTADGKTYKGSLNVDTQDECAATGDTGIAEIGVESNIMKRFEKTY